MTFIHFLTGKSSGILSGISSGILFGILSGIFSSICSGISSGILSDKSSGTLSGISSGILSDISSCILSRILSGISSGIYSDISSGILSGISSGLKLGLAMTTMTPTRPSQRRRLTSPLHEMDGTDEEEEIPETPVESELVASPLTSASLAQIVRDEVKNGMNTLEQQMTQLSVSVTARLDSVEHSLKDHDIKIAKLEHVITSNSSTPRSNTNVEQLEKHDREFAALKLQLDALKHGVADRTQRFRRLWYLVVSRHWALCMKQRNGSLKSCKRWMGQRMWELTWRPLRLMGCFLPNFGAHMNVTRRWLCSGVPTYKLVTVGSGQQRTFLCQFVLANCSC